MEEIDCEITIMESAYTEGFRLLSKDNGCSFCVRLVPCDTAVVDVNFHLPPEFPDQPLTCYVDGLLQNATLHVLNRYIHHVLEKNPSVRSMEICQLVLDKVMELGVNARKSSTPLTEKPRQEIVVARFLIYFHHIMR